MIEGTIRSGGAKGLGGELPGHVHYGIEGPPGGHYIPEVNQTGEKTAVITFTASKPDMPAVVPVEIELPVGPRGEKGADGNVSFDELTEAQREMLKGEKGDKGDKGDTGEKGEKGETGATGKTGPAGPQGERGETGPAGPQGSQGPQGQTGPQGERGPAGPQGNDYILTEADKKDIAEMAAELVEVPDSGGNVDLGVTGATVGQTVKISAVDDNGVPTAWESVDFPADEHINGLINTALGVIENGTY